MGAVLRISGAGLDRQYHGSQLYQQARGHQVPQTLFGSGASLELGFEPPDRPSSGTSGRQRQYNSGRSEQGLGGSPRVVPKSISSGRHLQVMGRSRCRPFCISNECEGLQVLVPEARAASSGSGCTLQQVTSGSPLRFSSFSAHPLGGPEIQERGRFDDSHRATLAATDLVSGSTGPAARTGSSPSSLGRCSNPVRRESITLESTVSKPSCLDPEERDLDLVGMSQGVKDVLLGSRKDSTRKAYSLKWRGFALWCVSRQFDPFSCSVSTVLEYLLSLSEGGLQTSSVRVHLAAISAFHARFGGYSLTQLRVVKRFLRGLLLSKPPLRKPLAQRDVNLVLSRLMLPPFELAESIVLKLLSWKMLFLVAITSACRISELQALVVHEPFTRFLRDKGSVEDSPSVLTQGGVGVSY
ncbi:uncharacterized protein LOC135360972 [Latimeria chalumnae]|uniref:uncharacterized protein LOC135360972 n=1 Tax=Latimeria chalumnae TaxID=7897 RepID=UPI00313F2F98